MKYLTAAIATMALSLAIVGCGSDNKSDTQHDINVHEHARHAAEQNRRRLHRREAHH